MRLSKIALLLLIPFIMMQVVSATSLSYGSNSITKVIDVGQNAIYTISSVTGGLIPYTVNAYYTNANVPAVNTFL